MKTIHKYTLQTVAKQVIEMPEESSILSFQMQGTHLVCWASVDTDNPLQKCTFEIVGTGQPLPEDDGATVAIYQDTVQQGQYVWHIFERI